MPKYAHQPQWRSRREAIGKKGELDYELLMDSELTINMKLGKRPTSPTTVAPSVSPTTVATFNFNAVPEMKPLPGAWVTVGKGGRPVKESLMYNEPAKPKLKSKKKRRARKGAASHPAVPLNAVPLFRLRRTYVSGEIYYSHVTYVCESRRSAQTSEEYPLEAYLASLEEAPSSSKCLQAVSCSTKQHQKEVDKAKEGKHWKEYRRAKAANMLARDRLIAALADIGMLDDESEEAVVVPELPKRRVDKGSSHAAKVRRKARLAAVAARCYPIEMGEDELLIELPPNPIQAKLTVPTAKRAVLAQIVPHTDVPVEKPLAYDFIPYEGGLEVSECSSSGEILVAKQPSLPNSKLPKTTREKNCTVM